MIRTVLFDLDDTLYAEREFYLGGFAIVAELLQMRGIGPARRSRELFGQLHCGEGREGVFDKAAARLGFPASWIPELVAAFHDHIPRLHLARETAETLAHLRPRYRLGIVTDGHAAVQRRKIEALGLTPQVDAIVFADDLGREHWKPDPLPFWKCCQSLQSKPEEAAFVGDHPYRDIEGARRAGLTAIRLRSPGSYFFDLPTPHGDAADYEIHRISELAKMLARLDCQEVSLP